MFFDKVVDVPVVLRNGVPQVHFIDGCHVPVIMHVERSAPHLAAWLRTWLGVQIVPASCSSSELSSHQMAIRSHLGLQKMPASVISSELSAHQMAPAGAIAHSRSHLCARASSFSFSSLVSPLRPLGLGLLGRCDPRSVIFFYVVADAGPASHRVRLWQGGPALRPRFPISSLVLLWYAVWH